MEDHSAAHNAAMDHHSTAMDDHSAAHSTAMDDHSAAHSTAMDHHSAAHNAAMDHHSIAMEPHTQAASHISNNSHGFSHGYNGSPAVYNASLGNNRWTAAIPVAMMTVFLLGAGGMVANALASGVSPIFVLPLAIFFVMYVIVIIITVGKCTKTMCFKNSASSGDIYPHGAHNNIQFSTDYTSNPGTVQIAPQGQSQQVPQCQGHQTPQCHCQQLPQCHHECQGQRKEVMPVPPSYNDAINSSARNTQYGPDMTTGGYMPENSQKRTWVQEQLVHPDPSCPPLVDKEVYTLV